MSWRDDVKSWVPAETLAAAAAAAAAKRAEEISLKAELAQLAASSAAAEAAYRKTLLSSAGVRARLAARAKISAAPAPAQAKVSVLSPIRAPSQLCDTCLVYNKTEGSCRGCDAEHEVTRPVTPTAPCLPALPVLEEEADAYILELIEDAYAIVARTTEALAVSHAAYLATREELAVIYTTLHSLDGKTAYEQQLVAQMIRACEDASVKLYLWHHGHSC